MSKRTWLISAGLVLAGGAVIFTSLKNSDEIKEERVETLVDKPNIVFIFADDFGQNVPSVNGNKYIQTPNIDAIANEGVRFKQNYVTAPICCASRAALLTGRYQQRFGSEFHLHYPSFSAYTADSVKYVKSLLQQNIAPDEKTQGVPSTEINYAELLKKNGYTTGIIGKWHAGFYDGYRPHQRGFDYSWGWYGGSTLYYTDENDLEKVTFKNKEGYHHYASNTNKYQWKRDPIATGIFRNGELVDEKEYQTSAIAREAVSFIDLNKDKPFFLYVPFGAIHTPLQAVKKDYDKLTHIKDEQQRILLAMTVSLDQAVGRILDKLKHEGLDSNTIVVFSGDNGSTYHRLNHNGKKESVTLYDESYENINYPLKGGKLTHYEGGIRTPLFIKWPQKIKAGTVYEAPVSTLDLFPTFAAATVTNLPADRTYDGVDLLPYITGTNKRKPHETLYWRNGFVKTIRKGDYKLLVNENDKTVFLYDLKNDPYEKEDLSSKLTQKVEELKTDYLAWEKGLGQPRWRSPKVTKIIVEGKQVSFQP
jgi:arylsulfatase A-like enzyme